jgi:hypothetical protein
MTRALFPTIPRCSVSLSPTLELFFCVHPEACCVQGQLPT